jgi:hypothetical protein
VTTDDLTRVGALLAVALSWLLLNVLSRRDWIRIVSLTGLLLFLAAASVVALAAAWPT